MNLLHPFREGNGQKVFFSAVCKPPGIELAYSRLGRGRQRSELSRRAEKKCLLDVKCAHEALIRW
jgi:fido (protein-threonine AMPylation protein)